MARVTAAAPGALSRIALRLKDWLSNFSGAEGSWRGPFYGLGNLGGWYQLGQLEDGFQRQLSIPFINGRLIPAAYAAVMANARAVSQCYATHRTIDEDGDADIVTTSAAARVLRNPNPTETWPQFILNMIAAMQFDGAGYAVAKRNGRGEVDTLWRMPRGMCMPYVAEDGSVFYSLGTNPLVPDMPTVGDTGMARASDVLHLRAYCPRHPLIGETPLAAAALAAGINVALSQSQLAFFSQMRRPSGALSTEQAVSANQMKEMRAAFDEQARRWEQGGMPILGHGLKFQPFAISSQDAQLIEAQRLSHEDIARVYGVPLPVIGDLTKATLQNVEALVNQWLAISLGALLENVERSLDALFGFGYGDYVELDVSALLRTDFAGRIDATCKGIQGGLFTPNEARAREGLSPVPNGDECYMQQQMVPLGTEPAPAPAPNSTPPAGSDGGDEGGNGSAPDDGADVGDDTPGAMALDEARQAILRAAFSSACAAKGD